MTPADTITHVGFFHFGGDKSKPVESLTAALKAFDDDVLRRSLVVLPEAFNINNGYFEPNGVDEGITGKLRRVPGEFGVALVAGLLDPPIALEPGFSSAYLIDRDDVFVQLSRKIGCDTSPKYKLSEMRNTPASHRGVRIGALLCMDAAGFKAVNHQHKDFLAKMAELCEGQSILCVPSRMGSFGTKEVVNGWPSDISVVLANTELSETHVSVVRVQSKPHTYGGGKAGNSNKIPWLVELATGERFSPR